MSLVGIPALALLLVLVVSCGSLAIAALALEHVVSSWAVFFFYVVPGLFFLFWAAHELAPSAARRVTTPIRRRVRTSRLGVPAPPPRELPPPPPRRELFDEGMLERIVRPWLGLMRGVLSIWRTRRIRRAVNVAFVVAAGVIVYEVVNEFGRRGWPLERTDVTLTIASCAFFLSAFAFKSLGWQRLFRPHERPRSLTLAAATGAASVAGLALPGRFDDALRIAIVRRMPGRTPGIGTLVLSLFLLGLIDTGALAPLAAIAAAIAPLETGARVGLAVVAFCGIGAVALLAALPRLPHHERLGRYRISHWLGKHAPASGRDAIVAWTFVAASWVARAAGLFVLLDAVGFGISFPLALSYLAAGAAASALPIGPAGAATQAGVGAAVLAAAGIDGRDAVAFAVAAQGLTVLAGAAFAAFAALLLGLRRLRPA